MKWENTLMAYDEDIKSRSFWDWIKAHTAFMNPLHRYKGVLELDVQKMTFTGKDVKVDKDFNLEIFVNFHRKYGMRTSDNKEVFEKLESYSRR